MKKVVLFIISLAITINIFAQTPEYTIEGENVVFTKIFEDTGLSIEEAHQLLEAHFSMLYSDVNNTCKLNQDNKLLYKGNYLLLEQSFNTYIRAEHTIDVTIKDGRVRVRIIADKMIFRGGNRIYDYMIVNAAPINDGKQPLNVTKKFATYYFSQLQNRVNDSFVGIGNALKKQTIETDEDW